MSSPPKPECDRCSPLHEGLRRRRKLLGIPDPADPDRKPGEDRVRSLDPRLRADLYHRRLFAPGWLLPKE